MAAKLSMSFTWPLYFSKSQVNSKKMCHKFHYLYSGMTHIYYFQDFTDGVNFGQHENIYLNTKSHTKNHGHKLGAKRLYNIFLTDQLFPWKAVAMGRHYCQYPSHPMQQLFIVTIVLEGPRLLFFVFPGCLSCCILQLCSSSLERQFLLLQGEVFWHQEYFQRPIYI